MLRVRMVDILAMIYWNSPYILTIFLIRYKKIDIMSILVRQNLQDSCHISLFH